MIQTRSKLTQWLIAVATVLSISHASPAATGHVFGDPPDENHPWAMHDLNRTVPPVVTPGSKIGDAPSDAVVLFDGTTASMQNWKHITPKNKRQADWKIVDGVLQCTPGAGTIATKAEMGDMQLHVEWAPPKDSGNKTGQGRGNSGVFLMGKVEVQVLDNYENPTYADGTAGAVYGVMPPAANALRGPDAWQSYDVIFRRPIVRDGEVIDVGSVTVLVNGVVVQDSTPLNGGGGYRQRKQIKDSLSFPDKGPISLQDHGNTVRYRNIWYRPLRPRPVDGGFDGMLSAEATHLKRQETAQKIRKEASGLAGNKKAFRLMDSLLYQTDKGVWAEAEKLALDYVREISSLSKKEIENRKSELVELYKMVMHLRKFERITGDTAIEQELEQLTAKQGWKVKL
jgi:hypothetical protein